MHKNIIITHGYSDSNKGDLAITAGTVKILHELYPDANITLQSVFSRKDKEFDYHNRFMLKHGINIGELPITSPYTDCQYGSMIRNFQAFLRLITSTVTAVLLCTFSSLYFLNRSQMASINTIKSADLVLLKGGQYIFNDQGVIRGNLYLIRILSPIIIAVKFHKPIILFGHSIGPIKGKIARWLCKHALSTCRAIIVRENLTKELLINLSVNAPIKLAPDIAFLTLPSKPTKTNLENFPSQIKWLGITVVNWHFPESNNVMTARKNYMEAIINVCLRASKILGFNILLIPQVTVQHHGESDIELIDKINDRLIQAGVEVKIISDDLWPSELSYIYGKCFALIGTRLHSCILAACSGTPIIAIRYQGYKTEGVMRELGLINYVHDIYTITADELWYSLQEVIEHHDIIKQNISDAVSNFRELIRNCAITNIY
jgi:polysaccharide pyruvyl transferase WcaK-like protein